MIRVVVTVGGGNVQHVGVNTPGVEVLVADYDDQDDCDNCLVDTWGDRCHAGLWRFTQHETCSPNTVEDFFARGGKVTV